MCIRDRANVAAINYHFSSKEKLFKIALKQAFKLAEATHPIRGTLTLEAPPQDRLRAFMEAVIKRIFDPGPSGLFDRILSHEGTREHTPPGMLISEIQKLQGDFIESIVTDLIGSPTTLLNRQARINIIALCIFPNIAKPARAILFPIHPTPDEIQSFIDGQVAFALAGLAALSNIEKTRS